MAEGTGTRESNVVLPLAVNATSCQTISTPQHGIPALENPTEEGTPQQTSKSVANVVHQLSNTTSGTYLKGHAQIKLESLPSTRAPSPVKPARLTATSGSDIDIEDPASLHYHEVGTLSSWRGIAILLIICGAQLMDNVFLTGVNISLPAIQREFGVNDAQLQWLISAYTLTFGGFLLLAGVMSDRYGKKPIFCAGMACLSIWTIANGFATSFIQLAIFRALQGIGAAMTVPSGVGLLSTYFVARDRTKALMFFGTAGGVGFCLGLIQGGFIASSLGWRYFFYINVAVTAVLAILGILIIANDHWEDGHVRPRLDVFGAGLSTAGLILLSFVLSGGGEYGWGTALIIASLVISVALLVIFTWIERKVQNPIMPLFLWKLPNFAVIWMSGFVMWGAYQTEFYYLTLICQDVIHLSAGATAIRLLPMGFVGGSVAMTMGWVMDKLNPKYLLLAGLVCCVIAPISSAVMKPGDIDFWKHVFPTSIIGVAGVAIGYCTITVVLLESVPASAKSLCGAMINTSFQLGGGVGLALATAIVQSTQTNKGRDLLAQYTTGMWCCVGLSGLGFLFSMLAVRSTKKVSGISSAETK